MVQTKSLKFLKNKQSAYFKEHGVYATDDIQISEWMEEYHGDCVMEKALSDTVLDNANEGLMLRNLWLSIVKERLKIDNINSYDVGNFTSDIIHSYRMTFIEYTSPTY